MSMMANVEEMSAAGMASSMVTESGKRANADILRA